MKIEAINLNLRNTTHFCLVCGAVLVYLQVQHFCPPNVPITSVSPSASISKYNSNLVCNAKNLAQLPENSGPTASGMSMSIFNNSGSASPSEAIPAIG